MVQTIPVKTLKNGFSLPELGLGTWLMGGERAPDAQADRAREVAAIRAALDYGFRHIDTAEMYAAGVAETIVAEAMAAFPRAEITLASKVMAHNIGHDNLLRSLDASLERLRTDHIDLYYIHAPNDEVPPAETARALNKAYADKRIRAIGVSNYLPARMDALQAHLDAPIVANQVHLNLIYRGPMAAGMMEHAQRHDYFVVAWRPVRFADRRLDPAQTHKNAWERGAYPLLDEMADKYGKTNVQTALKWVLSLPNTVTLVKSSQPKHIEELLGGCGWQFAPADLERLTRDFRPQEQTSNSVPLR